MSTHSKRQSTSSQLKKNQIPQSPSNNQKQTFQAKANFQQAEVKSETDSLQQVNDISTKEFQSSTTENYKIMVSQQTQTSEKQDDEPQNQTSPYFSNTKESENENQEKIISKLQDFLVPPHEQQSESLSPRQNDSEIHEINIAKKSDRIAHLYPNNQAFRNVRIQSTHYKKNSHSEINDKIYSSVERSPPQKINYLESPKTPQNIIVSSTSNMKTQNGNQKFISPTEQRKKPNFVEYIRSGVNKTPKTSHELSKSSYDKQQLREEIQKFDESRMTIEEQLYLKEEQIYKFKQELQRLEIEACHLRKLKYKKSLLQHS